MWRDRGRVRDGDDAQVTLHELLTAEAGGGDGLRLGYPRTASRSVSIQVAVVNDTGAFCNTMGFMVIYSLSCGLG